MKPRPDGHAICIMLWAVQLSTSSILSSGHLEIHGNVQLVGASWWYVLHLDSPGSVTAMTVNSRL